MSSEQKNKAAPPKKKVNLLDHDSVKNVLDEAVSEIVTGRGYVEDVRMSNLRLALGTVIIVIGLVAHFDKRKYPENQAFLVPCIGLYIVLSGLFHLLLPRLQEKDAIMSTYPPEGSYTSTGLVVSSKLPKCSDQYTLRVASADPKSISAGKPVEFTKSVTKWFTTEGVLVAGLFWKDVEALIDEYAAEPKKSK